MVTYHTYFPGHMLEKISFQRVNTSKDQEYFYYLIVTKNLRKSHLVKLMTMSLFDSVYILRTKYQKLVTVKFIPAVKCVYEVKSN